MRGPRRTSLDLQQVESSPQVMRVESAWHYLPKVVATVNDQSFVTPLATKRLLLRPWSQADVDALHNLQSDPEVLKHQPDGPSPRGSERPTLQQHLRSWRETGFGLWAVEHRETAAFIGAIGLKREGHWPDVELIWTLAPPYWGQGLATEGAEAAVEYGFVQRQLERLISVCMVGNIASERVMQKVGMARTDDSVCPLRGIPVVVYALSKAEWASRRPVGQTSRISS